MIHPLQRLILSVTKWLFPETYTRANPIQTTTITITFALQYNDNVTLWHPPHQQPLTQQQWTENYTHLYHTVQNHFMLHSIPFAVQYQRQTIHNGTVLYSISQEPEEESGFAGDMAYSTSTGPIPLEIILTQFSSSLPSTSSINDPQQRIKGLAPIDKRYDPQGTYYYRYLSQDQKNNVIKEIAMDPHHVCDINTRTVRVIPNFYNWNNDNSFINNDDYLDIGIPATDEYFIYVKRHWYDNEHDGYYDDGYNYKDKHDNQNDDTYDECNDEYDRYDDGYDDQRDGGYQSLASILSAVNPDTLNDQDFINYLQLKYTDFPPLVRYSHYIDTPLAPSTIFQSLLLRHRISTSTRAERIRQHINDPNGTGTTEDYRPQVIRDLSSINTTSSSQTVPDSIEATLAAQTVKQWNILPKSMTIIMICVACIITIKSLCIAIDDGKRSTESHIMELNTSSLFLITNQQSVIGPTLSMTDFSEFYPSHNTEYYANIRMINKEALSIFQIENESQIKGVTEAFQHCALTIPYSTLIFVNYDTIPLIQNYFTYLSYHCEHIKVIHNEEYPLFRMKHKQMETTGVTEAFNHLIYQHCTPSFLYIYCFISVKYSDLIIPRYGERCYSYYCGYNGFIYHRTYISHNCESIESIINEENLLFRIEHEQIETKGVTEAFNHLISQHCTPAFLYISCNSCFISIKYTDLFIPRYDTKCYLHYCEYIGSIYHSTYCSRYCEHMQFKCQMEVSMNQSYDRFSYKEIVL